MSDINPSHPPDQGKGPDSTPPGKVPKASSFKPFAPKGNSMESFKNWLGKKNYKKFITVLCQSISNQIKQQQKEQDLAARKLKASAEGQDPDEVTE